MLLVGRAISDRGHLSLTSMTVLLMIMLPMQHSVFSLKKPAFVAYVQPRSTAVTDVLVAWQQPEGGQGILQRPLQLLTPTFRG